MFLVDQLVDGILQWIDAPLVGQSAGEVARECRDALWRHVSGRIRGMTAAQARGYLRALAPQFVARGRCRFEPPASQPAHPLSRRCPGGRGGPRPACRRHPLRRTVVPAGFTGRLTGISREEPPAARPCGRCCAEAVRAPTTAHAPAGDWSIFRRERPFGPCACRRKHGPVPFPRRKGDSPIFSAILRKFGRRPRAAKIGTVPSKKSGSPLASVFKIRENGL